MRWAFYNSYHTRKMSASPRLKRWFWVPLEVQRGYTKLPPKHQMKTLFEKDLPWVFGCLIAVVTRTAFICSKIRTRWQFWGFVATLRHSLYIRTASSWHIFSNFLNCTGWNWFMGHLGSATCAEHSTHNFCPDKLITKIWDW